MNRIKEAKGVEKCPRCHNGTNNFWAYCPRCGEPLIEGDYYKTYIAKAIKEAEKEGYTIEIRPKPTLTESLIPTPTTDIKGNEEDKVLHKKLRKRSKKTQTGDNQK